MQKKSELFFSFPSESKFGEAKVTKNQAQNKDSYEKNSLYCGICS